MRLCLSIHTDGRLHMPKWTEFRSPLLKEDEVADILNVEVSTLRCWRSIGKPPRYVKVGAAVRYDLADIEAFIEAGWRNTTTTLLDPPDEDTSDEC